MSGKGRRDRKYVGSVASLSGVQSDYVDRALQPGDAQLLSYDPAVPIASPDPRTVVSYDFYAPYVQLFHPSPHPYLLRNCLSPFDIARRT